MTQHTPPDHETQPTSPSAGWRTVYNQFDAPTTAHDDTAAEIVTDGGTPRTGTVARRLDVEPDRLHQFVERHPEPTVSVVDTTFGVSDGDERLVRRWLEERMHGGETA